MKTASHASAATLPIGALARQAGVSTRTVRYYEEIGLLRTARRYAGGRRVFEGDALERLRFIGRLKRLGFSLEEIGELNEVFALHRSTGAMLRVLDGKLGQHLVSLEEQLRELGRLDHELRAYRDHVRRRLPAQGAERGSAGAERGNAGAERGSAGAARGNTDVAVRRVNGG
jgi:DNA-binding transcriptional MerR regulator